MQRGELQGQDLNHGKRLHLPALGLPEASQPRLHPQRVRPLRSAHLPIDVPQEGPQRICSMFPLSLPLVFQRSILRRTTAETQMERPNRGASPPAPPKLGTSAPYPVAVIPPV